MPAASANVARFLPEMARQAPHQCAVKAPAGRADDGSIRYLDRTFSQLNFESGAVARYLTDRGIVRGTRTLLMVKPGLDLILITFALFKIGAAPVVIDPGMGLKNFLRCVRRSQPQALVGIPLAQAVSRVFFPSFKSVKTRVTAGGIGMKRAIADASETFAMARTAPGDLAAILFTSGSTGPPKGVRYEHGMFDAQVRLIREHYRIEPGEVDLPMLPIFALFNPALGMTTVVPEMNPSKPAAADPGKIVLAIQQCRVTNSFGSPVLWAGIGRFCQQNGLRLPTLRRVLMAGAPVPPSLIRRYRDIVPNGTVHTPYGATECLPVSSISGPEILAKTWRHTERGKGTCVGRVLPEMEVRVIRIEDGAIPAFSPELELPPGEIGEIIVKGPVVTKAYDRLEEHTREAKIYENGEVWHRIGDLGYFDEEGKLWFCGRKAERVVTAQGVLFTDCCEAVFNRHPQVFRTALIGLGAKGRQVPAIVVEPEPGKFPRNETAENRFIAELKKLGAEHSMTGGISRFFFHKSFPVDVRHNAKIHRLALARQFGKQS